MDGDQQRITRHKRFVPYGTHANFGFAETSFMLETLYAIGFQNKEHEYEF